jgi:hypothetical protein
MPKFDFSPLYDQYPSIIALMPPVFTSHQFILELAHQNQVEYIEALYEYRNSLRSGKPAPFLTVHSVLAQRLNAFPQLISQNRKVTSKNIFGSEDSCAEWRKQ